MVQWTNLSAERREHERAAGGSMEKDTNILTIKLCKCGRAPHRKNQRNCHFCNREANAKYRRELKRMEGRLKIGGPAMKIVATQKHTS